MQQEKLLRQVISHQHRNASKPRPKAPSGYTEYTEYMSALGGGFGGSSCPFFANSRCATIKEEDGKCYLLMKVQGRAYANKNVWQKVKLRKNYAKALAQIEQYLAHWPRFLVHKNKQRLTRIYQYLVRTRKLDGIKCPPALLSAWGASQRRDRRRERRADGGASPDSCSPLEQARRAEEEAAEREEAERELQQRLGELTDEGSTLCQVHGKEVDGSMEDACCADSLPAAAACASAECLMMCGQIGTEFVMDEDLDEEDVVADNEEELARQYTAVEREVAAAGVEAEEEEEEEEEDGEEEVQYLEDVEVQLELARDGLMGTPYALEDIAEGEDEGEEDEEEDEEELQQQQRGQGCCGGRLWGRSCGGADCELQEEDLPSMDEDEQWEEERGCVGGTLMGQQQQGWSAWSWQGCPQQQQHRLAQRPRGAAGANKRGRGGCSGGAGTSPVCARPAKRRLSAVGGAGAGGVKRVAWVATAWQQQQQQQQQHERRSSGEEECAEALGCEEELELQQLPRRQRLCQWEM